MRKILVILLLLPLFVLNATNRIVSLAPNITEIIYALNSDQKLIGRSEECNFPEECTKIQNIGSPWKPDIEKIIMLKPDLVLASSLTDQSSIDVIKKAGIKIERINHEDSIEGVYSTIEEIANLIDSDSEELINDIKSKIGFVEMKLSKVKNKKKAIYLMNWTNGTYYSATGGTFIDGIIEKAGLINIAHNSKYWVVSSELIVRENPDIIFIPKYNGNTPDIKKLKKTRPFKNLDSKIVVIDGDSLERQGSRTGISVIELAEAAYPEYFR